MTVIAVVCFVVSLVEAALLYSNHRLEHQRELDREHIWQFMETIEGDKRALTESLCRAQGKPFISPGRQTLEPSPGWYDGPPEVKATPVS